MSENLGLYSTLHLIQGQATARHKAFVRLSSLTLGRGLILVVFGNHNRLLRCTFIYSKYSGPKMLILTVTFGSSVKS